MINLTVYHFEKEQKKSEDNFYGLAHIYKHRDDVQRGFILNLWEIHEIMMALRYAGYDKGLTDMFSETWIEILKELRNEKKSKK